MRKCKRKDIPIVITNIPDYESSGIYALVDDNGKMYIGSSINIKRRLSSHRFHLSAVKRGWGSGFVNKKMMVAIQQGKIFNAKILEKVSDISLLWDREKYYIEKMGGIQNLYNECCIPRKFMAKRK